MNEWLKKSWQILKTSGYIYVISSNVLIQFLGFVSVFIVAKILEPTELALIRSAQAYSAVLAILVGCGLTAPILRYCADPSIDFFIKKSLLSFALRKTIFISFIGVSISGGLIYFFVSDPEQRIGYATFALALPALSVTALFFVYLQARQQFLVLARSQVQIKLLAVVVVVLSTAVWGLYGFLYATLFAVYIGLVPLWWACDAHLQKPYRLSVPQDFNKLAFHSLLSMGLATLGQASDFLLLQFSGADKHEVGLYSLATIFLMAAMTVTGAFQSLVAPKFPALLNQPEVFRFRLNQWTLRAVILALGAAVACITLSWGLDRYFFGERYTGFMPILGILLIKQIVLSAYAIAGVALFCAGILKSGTLISAITTLLSFLIGYPMCLYFGVWGAAWTQVIVSIISLVMVWYALKLGLSKRFKKPVDFPN